jgi:hypothetical protein
VYRGSNQIVTDRLDVFVGDALPDNKVHELVKKCFEVRLHKLDDVNDANNVDYATRAGWLQQSLAPLMQCTWYEVRAFAGQRELTLKPHQWSRYLRACDSKASSASGQDAEPFSDASIADAWTYLKDTDKVQIAVTTYSVDDSVVGLLKLQPEHALSLWTNLSEKQKSNPRILRAFVLTNMLGDHIFEEVAKLLRPVCKNDERVACFVSELMAKCGAYKCSRQARVLLPQHGGNGGALLAVYRNVWGPPQMADVNGGGGGGGDGGGGGADGGGPWKPARVLGNVFSDVCHGELSPGSYTRDDVLARAKVCGDVLALHDCQYLDDVEIMTAALTSSFEHLLPSTFGCRNTLANDKTFMMTAFKKNIENLSKASQQVCDDPDMVAAQLEKGCVRFNITKADIVTDPVVAAHVLAYRSSYRTGFYHKVHVDKDAMLDIISRKASVLQGLFQSAKLTTRKQVAVWETAASELVNDEHFLLDCVKRNWRAATNVAQMRPHLSHKVWAAAFGFFKAAKFAAEYYSVILANERRNRRRFVFAPMQHLVAEVGVRIQQR